MAPYILRRLLALPFLLVLLALGTFLLLRLAPGGPLEQASEAARHGSAAWAWAMPDAPWPTRFWTWLVALLDGSLPSLRQVDVTVGEILVQGVPVSATLAGLSLVLAFAVGVPAGLFAALRSGTAWDRVIMSGAALGISVPAFVLGPILVLVFSLDLGWFPPALLEGPGSLVLPVLTLGTASAAWVARLTRSGMLDVLKLDFIRTAEAKGLSPRLVVLRHALRGGLVPLVAWVGPTVAAVVTSTTVVEQIYQVPGLGHAFVEAALNRDFTVVIGVITLLGALLLVLNLAADVAVAVLDPRVPGP